MLLNEQDRVPIELPDLLQTVAAEVQVYDRNAFEAEMNADGNNVLSVFAEKGEMGEWRISFWKIDGTARNRYSVDQTFLAYHRREYNLLFSICIKALRQMYPEDSEVIQRLQVSSYDLWLRDGFLKEWEDNLNDQLIRVEIQQKTQRSGVSQLLGRWFSRPSQIKTLGVLG